MAERRPRGRESRRTQRNKEYMIEAMTPEEEERLASRRRKRRGGALLPMLAVLLIVVLSGGLFGGVIAKKYAPSTERKDLNEWFEVSGNEARVYLNDALDREIVATVSGGTVYLPITWVSTNLNKRFYWQNGDGQLIYTLPDEVVRYTEESRETDGGAVYLLDESGNPLINLSTIEKYTDIRTDSFTSEADSAKRVFIYNDWSPIQLVTTKKAAQIRTKGGIKAPILADAAEGSELKVLETMDKWSRVVSSEGVIGFVQNKYLNDPSEKTLASSFEAPVFRHQELPEKVVMGWHMVFSKSAANTTLESYVENTKGVMNVICPTGIQIRDAEGNYENYIDETYVNSAHEKGLQVWVMIDNFNQPGGLKDFSTKEYFAHAENRQSFIDRLIADAVQYGYDGYNLDFEGLPSDAGPSYVQFYRELSVACRQNGLVLSIDNYVPYHFNDHYDLGEQGDFADYVVIMGYDEHTTGSEEAGSVASIGYTRYGIEETLKHVAPEHLINGIPFFTRVWKSSGPNLSSDAMGIIDAKAYVEAQGIELKWNVECGQYYGEKDTGTGMRRIWMEDERSIAEKVSAIKEYKLAGVAGWRLQYEPSDVWDEMDLNGVL
ncbi:MAG: glycosyl hydrolase family 18 protein [Eubacteriales bacterium]|nr:glycosyl hydrolase family 18 protein [Eubacteriales bacterium]